MSNSASSISSITAKRGRAASGIVMRSAAAHHSAGDDCLASSNDAPSNHCSNCFLQHHCWASELDEASCSAISTITDHPKPHQKGSHIYRQSSTFTHVYIVRSGAVKTYYLDEEGEENISGFYLPGELFGIDGLGEAGHRYSAQALDTTAVCAIEFGAFERLFGDYPQIQRQLMSVLCNELYARQQPLLRLRQHAAEEYLTTFLLDISERVARRSQQNGEFTLPMARRDIAKYLSLAEETLSRLFRRLQDRGLIGISGRKVTGFDQDAFRALTTSPVAGSR